MNALIMALKVKTAVEESMANHFEVILESAKNMDHGFEILEFFTGSY